MATNEPEPSIRIVSGLEQHIKGAILLTIPTIFECPFCNRDLGDVVEKDHPNWIPLIRRIIYLVKEDEARLGAIARDQIAKIS